MPPNPTSRRPLRRDSTLFVIIAFAVILLGVQSWISVRNSRRVDALVTQLTSVAADSLAGAKAREEVLSLRIQNELHRYFLTDLATSLGPTIAALVALIGAWIGFRGYLSTREKDRLDRAAADLKSLLDNLVGTEPRQRAGAVGLMHFLTADKEEYHLRVLSALLTAARTEDNAEVLRNIRIALDRAVTMLPEAVLQQGSWQGAKLSDATFAGRSLRNLDLRDAVLEDANLAKCDLTGANLTNARLNGAKMDGCVLADANLAYVDFAGASLVGANLTRANLRDAKIATLDFDKATLTGALMDADEIPWELAKNWRTATFDPGVRERLVARYGPAAGGVRVLMLMWEIAPLVAGGSWTACYHLVRQLRRAGADVTVVVPWDEASIVTSAFGCEVQVIALGITPPSAEPSVYGGADVAQGRGGFGDYWTSYGSPSQGRGWSGYSQTSFGWSPYSSPSSFSPWNTYSGLAQGRGGYAAYTPWSPYTAAERGERAQAGSAGSTMLWLMDEFRTRVIRRVATERFDLVHAHDWVTFRAAEAAATAKGVPWVAHFHSTERDRRPDGGDVLVERIERSGSATAAHIVVPSAVTKARVVDAYGVAPEKITVAPNVLSQDAVPSPQRGSFETKRVVFIGRLTPQKAPDRFARIATELRKRREGVAFWVFGAGELVRDLWPRGVTIRGPIAWDQRAWAYDQATVLVVPSRSEPFGMVVLEAMQHGVPVLYPIDSGAAEVLTSGVKIHAEVTEEAVEQLDRLLKDFTAWTSVVAEEMREVRGYADRKYEEKVRSAWQSALTAGKSSPT
jgi:glycosyltransferase involved in cell wall biosynthesis